MTLIRRYHGLAVGALLALIVAGCATQTVKKQAFTRIDQIETDLRRGITTKGDVLLLLGEPDGEGALGGFDALRDPGKYGNRPINSWFYESFDASVMGGLQMEQDILLVFFEGDIFDGFLWFSNKMTGDFE